MLRPDWVAQPMERAADLSEDNQALSSHLSDTGSIYEEESLDLGRKEVYAMSAREVIRVLPVLKNEKITFIDLMETVMISKDTSIRPFADKFIMSSRLECVLTAILKRARNGVLDSWLIYNTSLVGKRQLSSLRNRLHRPTSSYDQASLLGWTASSAGDLLQQHLPSIFTSSFGRSTLSTRMDLIPS